MEYRKLIKFGNSSHIISLPNSWVKKNKLRKGDLIYYTENGNNELVLNPKLKDEKQGVTEIMIDITNKNLNEMRREIHSAYINNFNTINIIGKDLKQLDNLLNGKRFRGTEISG